jgi:hypothetical protein
LAQLGSFANDLRSLFIIAHGDEGAMTQVPGISPFDECDLANSFGLTQRYWFIFYEVSDSHREALFSGRFLNWAPSGLQCLESREDLMSNPRLCYSGTLLLHFE